MMGMAAGLMIAGVRPVGANKNPLLEQKVARNTCRAATPPLKRPKPLGISIWTSGSG